MLQHHNTTARGGGVIKRNLRRVVDDRTVHIGSEQTTTRPKRSLCPCPTTTVPTNLVQRICLPRTPLRYQKITRYTYYMCVILYYVIIVVITYISFDLLKSRFVPFRPCDDCLKTVLFDYVTAVQSLAHSAELSKSLTLCVFLCARISFPQCLVPLETTTARIKQYYCIFLIICPANRFSATRA